MSIRDTQRSLEYLIGIDRRISTEKARRGNRILKLQKQLNGLVGEWISIELRAEKLISTLPTEERTLRPPDRRRGLYSPAIIQGAPGMALLFDWQRTIDEPALHCAVALNDLHSIAPLDGTNLEQALIDYEITLAARRRIR